MAYINNLSLMDSLSYLMAYVLFLMAYVFFDGLCVIFDGLCVFFGGLCVIFDGLCVSMWKTFMSFKSVLNFIHALTWVQTEFALIIRRV